MKAALLLWTIFFGTTCTLIATAGEIILGTPIVSCEVIRFRDHQQVERKDLSLKQCQGMESWIEEHHTGWQGMNTEAPLSQEPVELAIDLKHADGAITHISIALQANAKHYLRQVGPGKWAYKSFLGIWESWAALRPVSDQELETIKTLVAPPFASHFCWVEHVTNTGNSVNLYMRQGYVSAVRGATGKDGSRVVLISNKDGSLVLKEGYSIFLLGMIHDSCVGVIERRDNKLGIKLKATNCSLGLGCSQVEDFVAAE